MGSEIIIAICSCLALLGVVTNILYRDDILFRSELTIGGPYNHLFQEGVSAADVRKYVLIKKVAWASTGAALMGFITLLVV